MMITGIKKILVLSGLFLIPFVSTFGQDQFGRISGKVIDQATNNGVAFVTVYLYQGEYQKLSARSNSGGNFSFVNVAPDVYTIRTSKPNYQEYAKQVRVNPNFTTKLYIPLNAMGEAPSAAKPVQVADNVVVDQPAKSQPEIVKTSAPVSAPVVSAPAPSLPAQSSPQVSSPEVQTPVATTGQVSTAPAEIAAQEMEAISVQDDDQKIWEATEISPEIEGGFATVYKKLKYPEVAVIQKVEGTVVCSVYIDKEGNPINTEVLRSVHPSIDQAAQEALFNVKYIPGKQNGVAVSTKLTVPIKFKLSK